MEKITKKKSQNRCTFCKRSKTNSIREQMEREEFCESDFCEFITDIKDAIDQKSNINIVLKQKTIIPIIEKDKPSLSVIEKPKVKINIIKK